MLEHQLSSDNAHTVFLPNSSGRWLYEEKALAGTVAALIGGDGRKGLYTSPVVHIPAEVSVHGTHTVVFHIVIFYILYDVTTGYSTGYQAAQKRSCGCERARSQRRGRRLGSTTETRGEAP